jgi:hypothetical protein
VASGFSRKEITIRAIVVSMVVASAAVFAQGPQGPTFSTVSIKRSSVSGIGSSIAPWPDGSFGSIGASLTVLIGQAYPVNMQNIIGLPGWTRFFTFDVTATSPLGRDATPDERRAMMRTMLEHRFRLVAHIEDRGLGIPNLVPMPPADDTRRVLVVDHVEYPVED